MPPHTVDYISACSIVGNPSASSLHETTNKIFHLRKNIQQELDKRSKGFGDYIVGFHIRRTDNAMSVKNSPTEAFLDTVEKERLQHLNCTLFLATDSQNVKHIFKEKFPDIVTNPKKAERNSKERIIDGLLYMYLLSKCNIIYGSFYSSFSGFDQTIGNNKLVIIKK